MSGKFLATLEKAALDRRAAGTCGPYATGEENDVLAYHEVRDFLLEMPPSKWVSLAEVARECDVVEDFAKQVVEDMSE
jgi:hypothetical protein